MKHEIKVGILKRLRVKFRRDPGLLGKFATMVGSYGATFGEIATIEAGKNWKIRDLDIAVPDEETLDAICDHTRKMDGIDVVQVLDVVEQCHEGGKIEIGSRARLQSLDDLNIVYTPGVASICTKIHREPRLADRFTGIGRTVAIVTNGTAVLGLGDIGPRASMPVMEGKALLFKELADINGIPILVDSEDPDVVVSTVRAIAPTFGAIKLEDIRAPECFEIEDRLDAELDIPVVHDDQHGTAVVVLAAFLNIARYTYIHVRRSSVGIIGLGAAGMGIYKLFKAFGVQEIYGVDISDDAIKRFQAAGGVPQTLEGLMQKSKVVIATTGVPGLIKPAMVHAGQVILALSNPVPEIDPEEALAAGAIFAADGKAVNNALAFPGLFRGALDARARVVNDAMKVAAAKTIAGFAREGDLIPNILDRSVHAAVAKAVEQAALKTGAARYVDGLEI